MKTESDSIIQAELKKNISQLVEECRTEPEIGKKSHILYNINSLLPEVRQIRIPSLLTNDSIRVMLYRIEENIQM